MSLNLVSEQLLAANGLKHQDLFAILGQLAERRLDYGDLYFQSSYHESWVLEDRIIKDGSYNIDQGVGVRAISGEKTGFAYADQISLLALEQSAQAARTIVRDSGDGKVQTLGAVEHSPLYTSVDPLQSMSREEKLDILRRVDKVAREADKRVQEVTASLSGVYELILVAATDGTLAADVRPLVRLSVSVLVEEDGKRERGASGGGQVDITSGKFVFSTSEAYLIENGKVTKPVKGATLIGSGIETMQQISMVGNDLKLDNGVGVCGKEGQSLPVGVGQPTLKVDNLTVGGTA
ncbi:TPA: metallopeptidase TldD-related protein [Escherichia coli]